MKKVLQKKNAKEKNSHKTSNLYVEIENPNEKRKQILTGLKEIILGEEEIEIILKIKKEKSKVLSLIKEKINALNTDYKNLSESFPKIIEIENTRKEFENQSLKYKKQKKTEFSNSLDEIKNHKNLNKITNIKRNLDLIEEKLKKL